MAVRLLGGICAEAAGVTNLTSVFSRPAVDLQVTCGNEINISMC
jgi:hypothetical protein